LNAREKRNVFNLYLNVPSESLSVTVLGREFQVAGAEQQNGCLANAVVMHGSDNRVVTVCDMTCTATIFLGLTGQLYWSYSRLGRIVQMQIFGNCWNRSFYGQWLPSTERFI